MRRCVHYEWLQNPQKCPERPKSPPSTTTITTAVHQPKIQKMYRNPPAGKVVWRECGLMPAGTFTGIVSGCCSLPHLLGGRLGRVRPSLENPGRNLACNFLYAFCWWPPAPPHLPNGPVAVKGAAHWIKCAAPCVCSGCEAYLDHFRNLRTLA